MRRTRALPNHFAAGWFALFALLVVCIGGAWSSSGWAQVAESSTRVVAVKLEPKGPEGAQTWNLAAEFDIQLGYKLREALDRGLPLQFAVDFKLTEPRWYWIDKETASETYTLTLSYNALTRTYRVVTPRMTYSSPNLDDVMDQMSRVRDWPVIHKRDIKWGAGYVAQVRFRLLLTEMPKPFQMSALVNSEWDLASNWVNFEFTPRREVLK